MFCFSQNKVKFINWGVPSLGEILDHPILRNPNLINLNIYTTNKVFQFVFSQGWCCNPMHVGRTRMVKDTPASHSTFGMKTWSLTLKITKAQPTSPTMSIQKRLWKVWCNPILLGVRTCIYVYLSLLKPPIDNWLMNDTKPKHQTNNKQRNLMEHTMWKALEKSNKMRFLLSELFSGLQILKININLSFFKCFFILWIHVRKSFQCGWELRSHFDDQSDTLSKWYGSMGTSSYLQVIVSDGCRVLSLWRTGKTFFLFIDGQISKYLCHCAVVISLTNGTLLLADLRGCQRHAPPLWAQIISFSWRFRKQIG